MRGSVGTEGVRSHPGAERGEGSVSVTSWLCPSALALPSPFLSGLSLWRDGCIHGWERATSQRPRRVADRTQLCP